MTELWERFSFYGLQGILAFYLLYTLQEGGLGLGAAAAASIVGAYGGAVYLAQIFGAWMGDRVLAPKRLVFWGGVVITLGHLALAFIPGAAGLGLGLGLIVVGTGALKTNITSIVGFLLDSNQSKRDAGFSYFYMAINIGAVAGPLATGIAQSMVGFHLGFGLAAVGMMAALIQYAVGMRNLPEQASIVRNPLLRSKAWVPLLVVAVLAGVIIMAWSTRILNSGNMANATTLVIVGASVAYLAIMLSSKVVTPVEKTRLRGFIPLFIVSALYFGFLFQNFTTIAIIITERVDLHLGSWEFPAAWVTTMGPLAAVLATPLLAKSWSRKGNRQPNAAAKISFGMIQIGLGYVFLLIVSMLSGESIPLILMLVFMVIVGVSEVLVGPIGLSLATRIAPSMYKSQLVALIFFALAAGSSLSGLLGQIYAAMNHEAYLGMIAVIAIVLGLALRAFTQKINAAIGAGL
ncbi:peptide MFS transporter [Paeniglutamicibacter cryotolerans]|uniref:POT family proton-dependent oligopeptide transporter n=2 Tax=Paeniglutamicibacter cryotolerans TaxID=670079 RepID=A0A839QQD6_9MICC|nr:POT family proton-dependent oligopeptide transporter [Paeniglutamicibacter cryotolerans]